MKKTLLVTGLIAATTPIVSNANVFAAEVANNLVNEVELRGEARTTTIGVVNLKSTTNLNIRKSYSTSSAILGKVPGGKKVSITGENGNWYKVKYLNIEGYCSKEYIKVDGQNQNQNQNQNQTQVIKRGRVSDINVPLNIREKATTSSSVIGKLQRGDLVDIIDDSNSEWYKIKTQNVVGYSSKQYIDIVTTGNSGSQGAVNDSKVGKIATVTVGDYLNVRSGAGASYSIVSKLYSGDMVKVVQVSSNGWCKIETATGVSGWVNGSYLTNFREGQLSTGNNTSSEKVEKVIDLAKKQMGKPYVWGAQGPNSFDCSGLTHYVYKNAVGIALPRVSRDQAAVGTYVSRGSLKPGDLVFFGANNYISHVGLYIGDNQMIHAPQPGDVVKITRIDVGYHANRYITARRIIK